MGNVVTSLTSSQENQGIGVAASAKNVAQTPRQKLFTKSLKYHNNGSACTISFKCVLIGSSGVGKTSIRTKLMWDEFKEAATPTMGACRCSTKQVCGPFCFEIELWDTGSIDRYSSMVPMYTKEAACILIVYDVTDRETYLRALNVCKSLKDGLVEGAIVMLVGNKIDKTRREVTSEEAATACEAAGILCCEMSCKTNTDVRKPIEMLKNFLSTCVSFSEQLETPKSTSDEHKVSEEALASMIITQASADVYTAQGVASTRSLASSTSSTQWDLRTSQVMISIENSPYIRKVNHEYIFACIEREDKTSQCLSIELTLTRGHIYLENIQNGSSSALLGLFRYLSRREYAFKDPLLRCSVYQDLRHAQRVEIVFHRSVASLPYDVVHPDEGYEEERVVLLCPERDSLIKLLKYRLPARTTFDYGNNGLSPLDFVKTYREQCRYMKIAPVKAIDDQICGALDGFPSLLLARTSSDPKQIAAVMEAMRWNATIQLLDLRDNELRVPGIIPVCRLSHALLSLTHIDLSGNKLGHEGGSLVANLLVTSPQLKSLISDANRLGVSASHIGTALSRNNSLTLLSLSKNHINSDAVLCFARSLVVNTSLTSLDLSRNEITEEAVMPLLNMLSCNKTLVHLSMLGNADLQVSSVIDLTLPKSTLNESDATRRRSDVSGDSCSSDGSSSSFLDIIHENSSTNIDATSSISSSSLSESPPQSKTEEHLQQGISMSFPPDSMFKPR